ncbi:MAG: hypothetical protein R3293_00390 [Candidatus Promineifilaceae bacterium]|nr:hypothetical protein [Candidatus Promineifilaceae bacterium]
MKKVIISTLIQIYIYLLKLYPRHFRSSFAAEMTEVFTMMLSKADQEGIIAILKLFLRELAELPVALVKTYAEAARRHTTNPLSPVNGEVTRNIRWAARGLSLLIMGFVLLIFLFNEDVRMTPTPPTLILGILAICMIIAWRWEKVGGLLLLLGSPILFLSLLIQLFASGKLITPVWLILFLDMCLSLSIMIIGWFFISAAQHTKMELPLENEQSHSTRIGRRYLAYLLVVLLSLFVIGIFFVSISAPVSVEYHPATSLPAAK